MTSVSASGGRSPVRLCRIVPQTNDPPAWLKAGRAFSFLAALTPRPLRRSIVTVRIPRPSSPLGFRSTGFEASVIVFPVIALQGRQIAFERLCLRFTAPARAACCSSAQHGYSSTLSPHERLPWLPSSHHQWCVAPSWDWDASAPRCGLQAPQLPL